MKITPGMQCRRWMRPTRDGRPSLASSRMVRRNPHGSRPRPELGWRYTPWWTSTPLAQPYLEKALAANPKDANVLYYALAHGHGENSKDLATLDLYQRLLSVQRGDTTSSVATDHHNDGDHLHRSGGAGSRAAASSGAATSEAKTGLDDYPHRSDAGRRLEPSGAWWWTIGPVEDPLLPDEAMGWVLRASSPGSRQRKCPNAEAFVRWLGHHPSRNRPVVYSGVMGWLQDATTGKPVPAAALEELDQALG